MRKVRMIAKHPISIFALSVSFTFISCNRYNSINDEVTKVTKLNYDGKDMYKSIFFATGKFAKELNLYEAEIKKIGNMSLSQKNKFNESVDILLQEIEKQHPSFFENFQKDILSKNHQTVENAILSGADKIYECLHLLYPNINSLYDKIEKDYLNGELSTENGYIDDEKIEKKSLEYANILENNMITPENDAKLLGCSWAIACVLYAALAVHNTIAITALIAVAAAIKFKVGVSATLDKNNTLEFEMLVNNIVEHAEK